MLKDNELLYTIALTRIDGVGNSLAKNLISFCGSASGVFAEKRSALRKIPGIGVLTAQNIERFNAFASIESEMTLLDKHSIRILFYRDKAYPKRLKYFDDSPVILFSKGKADLNAKRIISIVGTRRSTTYGKQVTDQLVDELKNHQVMVVSGLASGTDSNAHRACIRNNMPTVGVLGHGFFTMYPRVNKYLSEQMLENGGLLTEYSFYMPGNKENFPKRNRIVAGMCDALIVVESGLKGGSLITADIANQYNKDVYAFPGKLYDCWSLGCNRLISQHQAAIIDSVLGLIRQLGYDIPERKQRVKQLNLWEALTQDELTVVESLKQGALSIDQLQITTDFQIGRLTLVLLDLEFKKLILILPGKMVSLSNEFEP